MNPLTQCARGKPPLVRSPSTSGVASAGFCILTRRPRTVGADAAVDDGRGPTGWTGRMTRGKRLWAFDDQERGVLVGDPTAPTLRTVLERAQQRSELGVEALMDTTRAHSIDRLCVTTGLRGNHFFRRNHRCPGNHHQPSIEWSDLSPTAKNSQRGSRSSRDEVRRKEVRVQIAPGPSMHRRRMDSQVLSSFRVEVVRSWLHSEAG
jgi:hypothetical protein